VQSVGGINGTNGINAVSGYLTNESHTFPASSTGVVSAANFQLGGGTFRVFNGTTEVTTECTFTIDSYSTDGSNNNVLTATINTSGVYSITAMTQDSATMVLKAVYGTTSITKTYTAAKSRTGSSGQRGSVTAEKSISGTAWSDTEANAYFSTNYSGTKVLNDRITLYNASQGFSETRYWDGSAWIEAAAVVDGNLIVTGTVTGDKLSANTITSDKMFIGGSGSALNDDPMFTDPSAWDLGANTTFASGTGIAGAVGNSYIICSSGLNRITYSKKKYPIGPGKKYRLSANLYAAAGNNRNMYISLQFYDNQDQYVSSTITGWGGTLSGYTYGGTPPTGVWTRLGAKFGTGTDKPIPANVRYAIVAIWFQYSGTGDSQVDQACQDLRLEELITGELIVDGSIKAGQIDSSGLTIRDADGNIVFGSGGTVSRSSTSTNIQFPGGGSLSSDASSQAGAIWIILPQPVAPNTTWPSTMLRFDIDIYEYSSAAVQTYTVGGYPYSGNNTWINTFATYTGDPSKVRRVVFGKDTPTGRPFIALGAFAGSWSYPKVTIKNLQLGYQNYEEAKWSTGWNLSFQTSRAYTGEVAIEQPKSGGAFSGLDQIIASNVGTFIGPGAIGNTQIGTVLLSTNFNGTIDSAGQITNIGTAGWAITKSPSKAVFRDVDITGTATITNGTFSGTLNAAGGTFNGEIAAGSISLAKLSGTNISYNTAGTYTATVPEGMTTAKVTLVGGGGGGSGGIRAYISTYYDYVVAGGGGGGGGGGTTIVTYTNLVPGTQYTVIVGAGGAGGANATTTSLPTSGSNGGSSSIAFSNNTSSAGGGFGATGTGSFSNYEYTINTYYSNYYWVETPDTRNLIYWGNAYVWGNFGGSNTIQAPSANATVIWGLDGRIYQRGTLQTTYTDYYGTTKYYSVRRTNYGIGGSGGSGSTAGSAGGSGQSGRPDLNQAKTGSGGNSGLNYGLGSSSGTGGFAGGGGAGGTRVNGSLQFVDINPGAGASGRVIIEFSNPQGVVIRTEWNSLIQQLKNTGYLPGTWTP